MASCKLRSTRCCVDVSLDVTRMYIVSCTCKLKLITITCIMYHVSCIHIHASCMCIAFVTCHTVKALPICDLVRTLKAAPWYVEHPVDTMSSPNTTPFRLRQADPSSHGADLPQSATGLCKETRPVLQGRLPKIPSCLLDTHPLTLWTQLLRKKKLTEVTSPWLWPKAPLKTKAVNGVQKLTVLHLFFFIAVVCHLRAGDCQSTLRHMA